MSGSPAAYAELERRFRRMSILDDALAVLRWDRSAMMPEGGGAARAEQIAALEVLGHELLCVPDLGDLLDAAEADAGALDTWSGANLHEMRRKWIHANAVPARLVEARSRAVSACEAAWRRARPEDDFAAVLPLLAEVVALTREQAAAKADALGVTPYEALLDEHEPGGRAQRIDAIFDDLAGFLPGFVDRVLERQAAQPRPTAPTGPFPIAAQRELSRGLCAEVGFDFAHGRLDESAHPFTGGVPEDVRITTRYSEDEFLPALMATLHETGHALYERGLPARWRHQPVGAARGMTLHESQSLLVEMQACRSAPFLAHLGPQLAAAFGGDPELWAVDNLVRLYRQVERGLIRVEADEVTYPAHVILRYRLERALLDGALEPADLPGAWSDGLHELLGVRPPDDRRGCLQDIHWYDGAIGYFPTYTLGAMAAAQLYAAAVAAVPNIPDHLARGDFAPLLGWLSAHVHSQGSRFTTDEILARATGRPLDPQAFEAHLTARYLD